MKFDKRMSVLLVMLFLVMILIATEIRVPHPQTTLAFFKPDVCTSPTQQMDTYNDATISRHPAGAYYDEQMWLDFADNMTALSYNVTAIAQNDTHVFGPVYLVNGRTNMNLWYQAGLSWNWVSNQSRTPEIGFHFFYQVWNTISNKSVFPNPYESGQLSFTKPVHSGDIVLLALTFEENEVNMSARDLETNGIATIGYGSYGAKEFEGANRPMEFSTSLMTEWYHELPFFCSNQTVVYSTQAPASSAWLGIDEWNFTGIPYQQWFNASDKRQTLFSISSDAAPLTNSVVPLEANGTRIYANSTQFWTM